jgi:hypothetical protein
MIFIVENSLCLSLIDSESGYSNGCGGDVVNLYHVTQHAYGSSHGCESNGYAEKNWIDIGYN